MKASALITELAQKSGLPTLQLNERGLARLRFDDDITVDLEQDTEDDVLHLYAVVVRPPAQDKETFYARLLEANLFCAQTGGATLALDRTRDEVLLCRRLDLANTDFAFFRQCLENLVVACERLRIDLSDDEHAGPDIPHAGGPTAASLLQRAERERNGMLR